MSYKCIASCTECKRGGSCVHGEVHNRSKDLEHCLLILGLECKRGRSAGSSPGREAELHSLDVTQQAGLALVHLHLDQAVQRVCLCDLEDTSRRRSACGGNMLMRPELSALFDARGMKLEIR